MQQEPFSDYSEEHVDLTGTIINEDDIIDDYEPSERGFELKFPSNSHNIT
mgnify:CR=1 FL=1